MQEASPSSLETDVFYDWSEKGGGGRKGFTLVLFLSLLSGCTVKAPSIAHTHIGHAMDGWVATPDQSGLFATAEKSARAALQATEAATAVQNLSSLQNNIYQAVNHTNPEFFKNEASVEKAQYGVI